MEEDCFGFLLYVVAFSPLQFWPTVLGAQPGSQPVEEGVQTVGPSWGVGFVLEGLLAGHCWVESEAVVATKFLAVEQIYFKKIH